MDEFPLLIVSCVFVANGDCLLSGWFPISTFMAYIQTSKCEKNQIITNIIILLKKKKKEKKIVLKKEIFFKSIKCY